MTSVKYLSKLNLFIEHIEILRDKYNFSSPLVYLIRVVTNIQTVLD